MKISIPKERRSHESRVAATPETVKKFVGLGLDVYVEQGAGNLASIQDQEYLDAGAKIAKTPKDLYAKADVVLKVQRPLLKGEEAASLDEVLLMPKGSVLISHLAYTTNPKHQEAYEKQGITAIAMESMPRITRAQSMDILSSQSNLAGYKAVLDATAESGKAFPMMMTAAGTIQPAKVLVIGAGVAGLQAIATAKRLGAVVSAFDVRPVAKEQVESLGAKFIEVESPADAETAGGYAKEMDAAYKKKQEALIKKTVETMDVVITTALIPGRPAPLLITEDMVQGMRPGSVIVDLAVEMGGNCALSEFGKVVEKHGVKLVGHANVPARLARDASPLYARNIYNFFQHLFDAETKQLNFNFEDEIIAEIVKVKDGVSRGKKHPTAAAPKKTKAATKGDKTPVKKTAKKPVKKTATKSGQTKK